MKITDSTLDRAIARGELGHLGSIFAAARERRTGLLMLHQHTREAPDGALRILAAQRPIIVLVGDDTEVALGPSAFPPNTLRALIAGAELAVVVSSSPMTGVYDRAAAALRACRGNIILIETRLEHETAWLALVKSIDPAVPLLLSTVKHGRA